MRKIRLQRKNSPSPEYSSPTGDFIDENDPALHEGGILDADVDEDDGSDAALEDQNWGM